MQIIKLGTYIHYKGTKVEVIGTALHSETLEEMVVYNHPDPMKGKKENTMWVRPKKMFLEKVSINDKQIPRFKFINTLKR